MFILLHDILDFVIPPHCSICGRSLVRTEKAICDECFNSIAIIVPPFCQRCGRPGEGNVCNDCIIQPHVFTRARALGRYSEVLKNLVLLFKGRRKVSIGRRLGQLLGTLVRGDEVLSRADIIIPVPLYHVARRRRGYNQCEILSREISEITGIPTTTDALVQVRPTRPQKSFSISRLSSAEQMSMRKSNVEGAFSVRHPASIADRRVIIVDDVCTTGATLDECAREIRLAGATEVYAAIVARAA
jgi:ComF family protein